MLNTVEPYFFISKYNSHRFVEVVNFEYTIKTVANTLSYQEQSILNNKDFYQLFQNDDATRTQFRSSYENHRVKVFNAIGEHDELDIHKRTENLNIEDYRTAKKISSNGKLAIYFKQGSILSSENTSMAPYDLRQYVPYWLIPGKNIVDDIHGEITIDSVVWLDHEEVYALIFDIPYLDTTAQHTQVRSVYNSVNYNVYEFDVSFNNYPEGYYQIQIEAWNDEDIKTSAVSERIHVKQKHENTSLIIHENTKNHQINYSWNIQHMMRLRWEDPIKYSPDGGNTINKSDQNTTLIDSDVFENYEMKFSAMPTGINIMLKMATAQDIFFMDGSSYTIEDNPETEKLEDLNEYATTLKMILANDVYNDKSILYTGLQGINLITINGAYLTNNTSLVSVS